VISEIIPDIPRGYTAVAEWSACLVYILLMRKQLSRPLLAVALGVGLAALYVVQTLAGHLPIALWTFGMLLSVAVMYCLVSVCTDQSPRATVYVTARAFVLAELVASLLWQFQSYFVSHDSGTRVAESAGLLVGVYAATFAMAYTLERRQTSGERAWEADPRDAVIALAIAAVTFFMSNMSFVNASTPFSGRLGLEIFYIRTLVDLAGFVALYAQQGQRLELQRTIEVEAMVRLLRTQHVQYLDSKRNIDVVNRKYHDLKHYISAIRAEHDPEAQASYLNQLEESITGYENHVNTGNTVLDTILTTKTGVCAAQGITLTCVADGTALGFMDPMSLSALVGNALDNAIESVLTLPDKERRLIQVAVYAKESFAVMRFENYFEGTLEFTDRLPRSTKSDSLHHGYGLINMRQVAQDHGGSLTVQTKDGWFVLSVLIPIPTT
jgi:branched-subunit amino acid transport protein AzlD